MSDTFEKNIAALREISPAAAEAVLAADGAPAGVEFFSARNGMLSARYTCKDGTPVQLVSAFDPEKEAQKFVSTLSPGLGKWIVWVSPLMWHGIRLIRKRMHHNPILVIERDTQFLRAVMERMPIDDILHMPGIRVITGPPEDIEAQITASPVRLSLPHNLIVSTNAAAMHADDNAHIIKALKKMAERAHLLLDPANVVRADSFGGLDLRGIRMLITANDRYSDAVIATLEPQGINIKSLFDFKNTFEMINFAPTHVFVFTANAIRWPDLAVIVAGLHEKCGSKVIVWNMEDPSHIADPASRESLYRFLRVTDLYYTQTAQFLGTYREAGIDAKYLPTGARPDMAGDPLPEEELEYDFSFFGYFTPWRQKFFDRLTALLPDMKGRIVGPGMAPEDFRSLIRRTRVNITAMTNCDITSHDHWALSDRVWEIPYAGGFLLQDYRRHVDDHFSKDEIAVFRGVEDCAKKIRRYAARPRERARILAAARRRIAAEHLWAHRMERILKDLNELK